MRRRTRSRITREGDSGVLPFDEPPGLFGWHRVLEMALIAATHPQWLNHRGLLVGEDSGHH